ncbi:hypothetical protein VTG60DRAFT_3143 [Thermothelomyces hinnuleus]
MEQQEPDTNGGPIAGIFPYRRQEPVLPAGYSWDREKASFCRKNLLVPADTIRRDGTIETKHSRLKRYYKQAGGLVFCHRGLYERASTIIENSIGALENGTRQGYHLHELDAFIWTKLDEAFMGHDQVADRITPRTGPWQQYTFQQVLQTLLVSRGVSNAFIELVPEADGGAAAATPPLTFSSTYERARDRVLGVLDTFWHDVLDKSGRTIQLDLREHDLAKAIPHYCFHISKVPNHRGKSRGAHETLIYKMFESTMWKGYNIHFSCFEELEQAIRKQSIEQYGADYFERRHLLLCPPLIMVFFADELVKLAKKTVPINNPNENRDSYAHIRHVAMKTISSFVGIDVGVGVGQAHPRLRPHQQQQQRTATYNFILEIGYSGLGLGYDVSAKTATNPLTGKRIKDPQVVFDSLVDRALIDVARELRETYPGLLLASCTRMPDVVTPKGNFKASFTTAELGPWPQGEKRIAAELRAIHGGLYPQSDLVVADNPAAEIAARVWIDKALRLDRKKLLNGPPYYEWLKGGGDNDGQNELVEFLRGLNTNFAANTVGQSRRGVTVTIRPSKIDDAAICSWEEAGALSPSRGRTAEPLAPPPVRYNGGDDMDEGISPLAIQLSGKHGFVIDDPPEARRAFARLFREAQAARGGGGGGGDAALARPVRVRTAGRTYTFSTIASARRSIANLQIYKAASEGRIVVLRELLVESKEADINALAGPHGTALGAACAVGEIVVVRWLLENGAQVNPNTPSHATPLEAACAKGHSTLVNLLLRAGAYPNGVANMVPQAQTHPNTPLLAACSYGHPRIVKMLLQYGADPNTGMRWGKTPLGVACARGYTEIVDKLLVHLGANYDIDTCTRHLSIALQHVCAAPAIAESRDALMAMLLAQGANINLEAQPHGTALIAACDRGHLPTVQLLLDRQAHVDPTPAPQTYHHGTVTALVVASRRGHLPVVQMLLKRGADPNFMPYTGFTTALEAACGRRDAVPIIQELLAAGANVNLGRPLYIACITRNEDVVDFLLRNGAPVSFSILRKEFTTPKILSRLIVAQTKFEQQPSLEAQLARAAISGSGAVNKDYSTLPRPCHMKETDPALKRISPRVITKERPRDKQILPMNKPSPGQVIRDELMTGQPVPTCGCLICLLDDRLQSNYVPNNSSRHNPVTHTLGGMDLRPRRS